MHLYLDEFANIGVLPAIRHDHLSGEGEGIIRLARPAKPVPVRSARYGRANAQTIVTNCATKIALSGLDYETARYVSQLAGGGDGDSKAALGAASPFRIVCGFGGGLSRGTRHDRLLTADEVRRIGEGEALVITGNRRPLLIDKYRYLAAMPRAALAGALGEARALEMPAEMVIAPAGEEPSAILATEPVEALPPSPFRMQSRGARKGKRAGRRSTVIASQTRY